MVSPQIILVVLAVIAFFATGGIDKAGRAITTAKADFVTVKGKITDFQSSIITTSEAKGKDQPQSTSLSNVPNQSLMRGF